MSAVELCIGLTCLAFTTYKPLFKKDFFGRSSASDSNEKDGTPLNPYVAPPSDPMDRHRKQPQDPYDVEGGFPGKLSANTSSSEGEESVETNEVVKTPVLSREDLTGGQYFEQVGQRPILLGGPLNRDVERSV